MKEQKVLITDSQFDVNDFIGRGWTVVSVTAQHVASGGGGKFCFVLERDK